MKKQLKSDIEILTQYIFDTEYADFIEHLTNGDDDTLFKDEVEIVIDDPESDEAEAIIQKTALNPECNHPYALASRIWYSVNEEK